MTDEIQTRSSMTVKLIQHMGSDAMIVAAAKVSTAGAESEDCLDDEVNGKLLNFLMKNRHGTPFEHGAMTFLIEAPIFVFREFHRHRVGWSYNEESARYRQLKPVFYLPDRERNLVQIGKPGHYKFVPGTTEQYDSMENYVFGRSYAAYAAYEAMLDRGVSREVARVVLPVNIYSSMYATCNPRSLMHFLSLRTKRDRPYFSLGQVGPMAPTYDAAAFPSYPQREIEMVAEGMEEAFAEKWPITYDVYCKNGRVAP